MLDNIADQIEEDNEDEDDDTEELEDRLDILRGDKPRNKKLVDDKSENTLVTLPLEDVEELRRRLRNMEDINEDLGHKLEDYEELGKKFKNLEDTNEELAQKLKELEEKIKRKEPKKNKEQAREKFIVIDMETNDEMDDVECLIKNKESGYSRSNPQSEPQKKKETVFDCPDCGKTFIKREHMVSHQKNHEASCQMCDKLFKNSKKLKEHIKSDHDEMICHAQCEGGKCTRSEIESQQMENPYKCNLCEQVFPSRNILSTHKADVHRTFKPCRDITNCRYQAGCYFSHVPVTVGKVRCFQCGEEFDTKHTMMIHRKIHGVVKECIRLTNNQCDRGDNCWWSHASSHQVFQQVEENLPPPIQKMQTPMKPQEMEMQSMPHNILVSMLKAMETELKKIKEVLNIN